LPWVVLDEKAHEHICVQQELFHLVLLLCNAVVPGDGGFRETASHTFFVNRNNPGFQAPGKFADGTYAPPHQFVALHFPYNALPDFQRDFPAYFLRYGDLPL